MNSLFSLSIFLAPFFEAGFVSREVSWNPERDRHLENAIKLRQAEKKPYVVPPPPENVKYDVLTFKDLRHDPEFTAHMARVVANAELHVKMITGQKSLFHIAPKGPILGLRLSKSLRIHQNLPEFL